MPILRRAKNGRDDGPTSESGWVVVPIGELPHEVQAFVADVDGVPQLIGLRIEPHAAWLASDELRRRPSILAGSLGKGVDPTITADLMRRLPLRLLRDSAAQVGAPEEIHPLAINRRPTDPWPDEHFNLVADTYRAATSAPLRAIQAKWSVSRPTASNWVRTARERGLLGWPSRRGVAGASATKTPFKSDRRKSR